MPCAPAHRWRSGRRLAVALCAAGLVSLGVAPAARIAAAPLSPGARPGAGAAPRAAANQPARALGPDANPPEVTLSPWGGTFTTSSVNVTITWCDDSSLYAATKHVTLDGTLLTTNYTTLSPTIRCPARAQTTLTLSLTPGSHALHAEIEDQALNLGTADGTFTYTPTPVYAVTVGGDSGTVNQPSRTDAATTFTVTNTGNTITTYTLRLTCPSTAFASCSAPSAVTIANGGSTKVTAGYTTAVGLVSGSISLTALAQPDTTKKATGADGVIVLAPPLVALVNTIPGTRERSQCLAFGIVESLATDCGAIRVTHPLPSVTTYGKARTPTLVYYTDAVQGPVIGADVTPRANISVDSVTLDLYQVTGGGESQVNHRAFTGWSCNGCTQRIAGLLWPLSTRIWKVHAYVKVYSGGGATPDTGSAFTEIPEVYRVASKFGAGWWLAGVEQLVFSQPDTAGVLWIGGDESTRKYTWARYDGATNRAYYVAPSLTRPDTLVRSLAAADTGRAWYRILSTKDTVFFDQWGWHVKTVSHLGYATQLAWTAGSGTDPQLESLTVPGGLVYRWFHADTVDSIVAPGASGNRAARLHHFSVTSRNRGVTSIVDPDGKSVSFTFFSWGSDFAYNGRTDRRGTYTHFEWEGYSPDLSYDTTRANPTQTVVHTFRNAYAIGAPPGTPPMLRDSAYTRYTDPRGNVTKFWVNELGAPVKIVNALNQTTLIRYTDARFPGLATETVAPNGLVTRAWYNGRGLVDSATTFNPFADGRNATTRMHWHPSLPVATLITNPEGDADSLTYDGGTGNRLSEQPGSDTTRKVQYTYNAANQLWKIQMPGTSGFTEFQYDATLRNVSQVTSPLGYQTRYVTDALGRDTLVKSQITPGDLNNWQSVRQALDVMDRPYMVVTSGPAMNGAAAETTTVATTYNPEGQPLSVTRTFSPDGGTFGTFTAPPVGALVTTWAYDSLGRVVAQYAPRRSGDAIVYRDSTVYDLAGNPVSTYSRRGLRIDMQYDALNRLTSRRRPAVAYARVAPTLGDNNSVDVRADSFPRFAIGSTQATIDADRDTLVYDPVMGWLNEADNGNARVSRAYWPSGALRSERSVLRDVADTLWGHDYLTSYSYDLDGRRTAITHPVQLTPAGAGGQTTYGYDALTGALNRVTDLLGNAVTLGYSLRGDLTSISYPGGLRNGFGLDADGELVGDTLVKTGINAGTFRASAMSYDARGKTLRQTNQYGWSDSTVSSYTGLGRVLSSTYVATANTYVPGSPYNTFESQSFYGYDGLGDALVDSSRSTQASADGTTSAGWGPFTKHYNAFETGTGRLTSAFEYYDGIARRKGRFVYDSAGNTRHQPDSLAISWSTSQERAMYYDAGEHLVAADWRSTVKGTFVDQQYHMVFDLHRYDALGRRVLTYSRRDCYDPSGSAAYVECRRGFIRRTVWDGNSELYEIEMPDEPGTLENDTAAVLVTAVDTQGGYWDTKPYFGRVAYTTGVAIDRPLGVVRINYVSASTGSGGYPNRTQQAPHVWAAFAYFPMWDARGQVEAPYFPATQAFGYYEAVDTTRHLLTDFFQTWFPYARQLTPIAPRSWLGSVVDDKRDKTGLLYRRNRMYDAATGRFTQEDPIGLAGGLNVYGFAAGDPITYSDPFGLRPPTQQEIHDLGTICTTIDCTKLNIHDGKDGWWTNLKRRVLTVFGRSVTYGYDIYLAKGQTNMHTLAHEATHVVQWQSVGTRKFYGDEVGDQISNSAHKYSRGHIGKDAYELPSVLPAATPFSAYGWEQQAGIVEGCYQALSNYCVVSPFSFPADRQHP